MGGGGIEVRWYDTHGEQFHTKLLAFHTNRGTTLLVAPPTSPAETLATTISKRISSCERTTL